MKKIPDKLKSVLPKPIKCEAEIDGGYGISFMKYASLEEAEKSTESLRKSGSRITFFTVYNIFGKEYKRKAF